MKKYFTISVLLFFALFSKAISQSPVVAPAQKKTVILTGGTIHTGTGNIIENGTIAFTAGKITFVGKSSDYSGDKSGSDVIDVSGKQVYPGLIFPATSLGLVEIGSGVDVATDNRETGDLNPNVRALVAYNTDSHVIPVIRSNGILLAQICPVAGGQKYEENKKCKLSVHMTLVACCLLLVDCIVCRVPFVCYSAIFSYFDWKRL